MSDLGSDEYEDEAGPYLGVSFIFKYGNTVYVSISDVRSILALVTVTTTPNPKLLNSNHITQPNR